MLDIDPVTLIVSSILLMAFIVPFAYQAIKVKKASKVLASNFLDFVKDAGINPVQIEKWRNHYTLGLDPSQNKLVYFRYGDYPEQTVVDLKEVKRISLQEKNRPVMVGKEKRNILDYLAIQFHFIDSNHLPKTLEIYDGELFSDHAGERVIANKWIEILSRQLKSA